MSRMLLALDWNGRVVDDAPRAYHALLTVLGSGRNRPKTIGEFRQGFCLPLRSWFARVGVAETELATTETRWNEEIARHPAPLTPGARELLTWCGRQRIPVRVVTGAQPEVVEADARRLGVRRDLDGVVGSAHPKAAVLSRWRSRWDVVYVGDTEYDIEQAHLAGVVPVAFACGYRPEEALRDCRPALVIHALTELVPLLRNDGSHR